MFKNFKFKKLEEESIPKLVFGKKLSSSAYGQGRLHPALEGMLHYLHFHGSVSPTPMEYGLTDYEIQLKDELIRHLKKGSFFEIDANVHTSIVILAVLKEYISSLPRPLFKGIKIKQWCQLRDMLPEIKCSGQDIPPLRERYSKDEIQDLMFSVKFPRRSFIGKLLISLHEMCARSEEGVLKASAWLSSFLTPGIMYKEEKNKLQGEQKDDLEFCLRYMIIKAPNIFCGFSRMLLSTFPIRNLKDDKKKASEIGEDALKLFAEKVAF